MIGTLLLAFSEVSERAAAELKRAGCPVHEKVVGAYVDDDVSIKIAELHYYYDPERHWENDLQTLSVWDHIREVQIRSLDLYLKREWIEGVGWRLTEYDEGPEIVLPDDPGDDDLLGDLEEHPF